MSSLSFVENLKSCLRNVGEDDRIYPKGKRIEVVFLIEAANYLLLRTEGQGYINAAILPQSKLEVPVILPEKIQAVTRRMMLHLLRDHRDKSQDKLKSFIEKAKELGFIKAMEHLKTGWNCSIQPPIADSGEKSTDLGMDGYCPACALFGAALTDNHNELLKDASVGIKTRVHFDPAFATKRSIVPETHNKVTEGLLSSTGQALYSEVHVEPGTVFIGRALLTEVTEPELLSFLYTLAHVEEIGGRSGVYGTIRVHLLGLRCGKYSSTTALSLTEETVKENKSNINEIKEYLNSKLNSLGFVSIDTETILNTYDNQNNNKIFIDLFNKLWESTLDYDEKWVNWFKELNPSSKKNKSKGKTESEENEEE